MSSSDININGGKGVNTPTAKAAAKYWDGYDAIDWGKGKRTTHANTLAFGDDPAAPLDQPVSAESFSGYIPAEPAQDCE